MSQQAYATSRVSLRVPVPQSVLVLVVSVLSYQLGERPFAHAALFERHDEPLSRAISRSVASVCGH
jgi:hypothetical protein